MQKNYRPNAPQKKKSLPKSRLIIGRKPMLEALANGANIEKIFLLQGATGEEIYQIRAAAKEMKIPVSVVPQEKLNRFSTAPSQGVVAIAGLIQFHKLQDIIDQVISEGKSPLIVVLEGITDTRNVGAIARTALCFGADAIVYPEVDSAPVTEDAIKTSAGALEQLPICRASTIQEIMDTLHLNGLRTVATALQTDQWAYSEDYSVPTAIILGSEGKGVSNFVLKSAHSLVKIPQVNNFDSLNVSVAAGVMLYEIYKNRFVTK